MADHLQLAVVVVEAQDQRAERALLLAGAPADDDGVDRPHALDLHHPGALAGPVGGVQLLGDHALRALQPRLGLRAVERARREVERLLDQLLEPLAPARERLVEQHLAVLLEQVEGDEPGRRLLGQPSHARLGRVDALLERVELLAGRRRPRITSSPSSTYSPGGNRSSGK